MTILGIDPGRSGALALVGTGEPETFRLDETEADIFAWLAARIDAIGFALLERASSRPGQGVASTFKFGQSYGLVRGLLVACKVPFETSTPSQWTRKMGVTAPRGARKTEIKRIHKAAGARAVPAHHRDQRHRRRAADRRVRPAAGRGAGSRLVDPLIGHSAVCRSLSKPHRMPTF